MTTPVTPPSAPPWAPRLDSARQRDARPDDRDHAPLHELLRQLPAVLRRLRQVRGGPAGLLEAGRLLANPDLAVHVAHVLVGLGRTDECRLVLQTLQAADFASRADVLEWVAREAVETRQHSVVEALRQRRYELPERVVAVLDAASDFERGALSLAHASHLAADSDPTQQLLRVRALLAANRVDEARAALEQSAHGPDELSVEFARDEGNRAVADLGAGRYAEAAHRLERVVDVFERAELHVPLAIGLHNVAAAWEILGRYADAQRALTRCLEQLRGDESAHERMRLRVGVSIATVDTTLGRLDRAVAQLERTQDEARKARNGALEADALVHLARAHLCAGDLSEAQRHLARCRGPAEQWATDDVRARAAIVELEVRLMTGAEAAAIADFSDEVRPETRREAAVAGAWRAIADRQFDEAKSLLQPVVDHADHVGHADIRWTARRLLAAAHFATGDAAGALEWTAQADRICADLERGLPPAWRKAFREHPRHLALRQLVDSCAQSAQTAATSPMAAAATGMPTRPTRSTSKVVGRDPGLLAALALAERFAPAGAPLLVTGETGTGKELVAELVHEWSERRGPLVRVNAAALTESLLLSELFGAEKGAFTGADTRRTGKFEAAEGGTLFLDEIAEISPNAQAALLRVLQDGTFHRVGGTELVRCDVRIVTASHHDLAALVDKGRFRADLYYRLSALTVRLPALRERSGDIPLLVDKARAWAGAPPVEDSAIRWFCAQPWPGNVRQLLHAVQRLALLAAGAPITRALCESQGQPRRSSTAAAPVTDSVERAKAQLEVERIAAALAESGQNITHAAERLGVSRSALSRRIKRLRQSGEWPGDDA